MKRLALAKSVLSALICDRTFFFFGAVSVFRLLLTGHEEIVARNQPYDDLWQLMAAERLYWFGNGYNNLSFVHLPAYPLWVASIQNTGIPLRIAEEIFFVGAGYFFVRVIAKTGVPAFVCLLAYCAIVFHPVSFQFFNLTLAEAIYAPMLLVSLGFVILLWLKRETPKAPYCSVLTGAVLALLWNIRKENILIVGLLAAVAASAYFSASQGHHQRTRDRIRAVVITALLPAGVILICTVLIASANLIRFGLFTTSELNAPGYTAAYRALLRIKPDHPIRFVPFPKEVRKRAYAVSPAFKELEPLFEGEYGYAAASETRKAMGIKDEIAAGWVYWSLRDAAALAGHHNSAFEADVYYQRIADDINKAIDDGRLQGRRVWVNFLDPAFDNFLPFLPQSFLRVWMVFISLEQPPRARDESALSNSARETFDRVANRRTALTDSGHLRIQGWLFSRTDNIARVQLRLPNGQVLASADHFLLREDVAKSYAAAGVANVPHNVGFELSVNGTDSLYERVDFVATSQQGAEFSTQYTEVPLGRPLSAQLGSTPHEVTYAFDAVTTTQGLKDWRWSIQGWFWSVYGRVVLVCSYVGMIAAAISLFGFRYELKHRTIYFVLALLAFVVVTRIALFALIDASAWPANQSRYLFPVAPIYSCLLILLIYQACRVSNSLLKFSR